MLDKLMPLNYAKAHLDSKRKLPKEVDLIYSYNHIVPREVPWIVHLEWFNIPVGRDPRWLPAYLPKVLHYLESDYCKKILFWTEKARDTFLKVGGLLGKTEVIPTTVKTKNFDRRIDRHRRINLLFVGPLDTYGNDFLMKGGNYIIEAFLELRKHYDIELTIRASIPKIYKEKLKCLKNVELIDYIVPQGVIDELFMRGDIFVLPTFLTHNPVVIEAMAWGLPVITSYSGSSFGEYIGPHNGAVVRHSWDNGLIDKDNLLVSETTRRFDILKRRLDRDFLDKLVKAIVTYLEDPYLRLQVGATNIQETNCGRFSTAYRNEKLKRVFDEALGQNT